VNVVAVPAGGNDVAAAQFVLSVTATGSACVTENAALAEAPSMSTLIIKPANSTPIRRGPRQRMGLPVGVPHGPHRPARAARA
jgi:hypothetical protein